MLFIKKKVNFALPLPDIILIHIFQETQEYLGVELDKKLKWNSYFKNIYNMATRAISVNTFSEELESSNAK